MSDKFSSFFIPKNIPANTALEFSSVLAGNLLNMFPGREAEIFTTTALIHSSWSESETMTMKGFIAYLKTLTKYQNAMELAEGIMNKNNSNFRNPETGSLSGEMMDVHSLMLRSLALLTKSRVNFNYLVNMTTNHIESLCNLPDEIAYPIMSDLNDIKRHMIPDFSQQHQTILDIVRAAAANGNMPHIAFLNSAGMPIAISPESLPVKSAANLIPQEKNGTGVAIYDRQAAIKLASKLAGQSPQESNAAQRQLILDMANEDSWRPLTELPENYQQAIDELYARFPHFSQVIDFIAERLALSSCGTEGKIVRIAPVLLRGMPGTGKTYFAQEVARLLNLNFVEKDLSITSEAFVIAGMDSSWKNSKPGVVFNTLVSGPTANPLILLNEIDKCQSGGNRNSPLTTLHWLLEPTSAHKFQDEFIPLDIRTDNVVWFLTANDGFIPDPILSRMEVFDIPKPTVEQCGAIATSVWKSLCEKEFPKGHGFADEIPQDVLEAISSISPRIMRKTLTQAAAKSIMAGRKFLIMQDFEQSMSRYQEKKRTPIGFNNQ